MFKGDNLPVFGWSSDWACQKLLTLGFSQHHKCNKCQTLHDGTTHQALPVHDTFSDLYIIKRSQQCHS